MSTILKTAMGLHPSWVRIPRPPRVVISQEIVAGGGVDDADVVVLDEQDDGGSGVGSADADVVEAAVAAQDDDAGVIDRVMADPVMVSWSRLPVVAALGSQSCCCLRRRQERVRVPHRARRHQLSRFRFHSLASRSVWTTNSVFAAVYASRSLRCATANWCLSC
jgi:hypothetical protein